MNLFNWASRWNIPAAAVQELQTLFGINESGLPLEDSSEAAIINIVRLEASKKNVTLWRNNVGALYTNDGRFIRFGLANESKAVNKTIKSGDLIGIKPILITQEHLGKTIGQFISRETKASTWQFKGDEHEQAQLNWIHFINSKGGDAQFCTGAGSL